MPLLELEKDTGGRNTVYSATYLFDESPRQQDISKSQYNRLVGQDTVDILVYEDTASIVGSKPRYVLIIPTMMMGAMGVLITGAVVLGSLHWIWRRLGLPDLLARRHQRDVDM